MIKLTVNGTEHALELDPDMPLLWAIREHVGLTGPSMAAGSPTAGPAPCTNPSRPASRRWRR
jgi:isoquinoline 1-oxidoreductase alpha subunit